MSCADRQFFVYLMASSKHGTLYAGMTNDLLRRAWEHREGVIEGFTKKYGVKRLVHFEVFDDVPNAKQRERSLKRWPRAWKTNLIEQHNPHWDDLYLELTRTPSVEEWNAMLLRRKGELG